MNANYDLKHSVLETEDSYSDLRIKFDTELKFGRQINAKIIIAYGTLGIIKRNFLYLSQECFVTL